MKNPLMQIAATGGLALLGGLVLASPSPAGVPPAQPVLTKLKVTPGTIRPAARDSGRSATRPRVGFTLSIASDVKLVVRRVRRGADPAVAKRSVESTAGANVVPFAGAMATLPSGDYALTAKPENS